MMLLRMNWTMKDMIINGGGFKNSGQNLINISDIINQNKEKISTYYIVYSIFEIFPGI